MYLIYTGPLEAVEVPNDLVPDGYSIATRNGDPIDFPDEIAEGLLEQGRDSAEDDPQHQPQWIAATDEQISAAAVKAAAGELTLEQQIPKATGAKLDEIAEQLGYVFAEGVTKVADKKASLLEHLAQTAVSANGDSA